MKRDQYIGTVINGYRVIYRCFKRARDGHALYNVKCVRCGHILRHARISNLKAILNTECKHDKGIWDTGAPYRLKHIFNGMRHRCYSISDKSYRFYGEKGVRICDEWLNDPNTFIKWALANGYTPNLTIDRKDSSKDYSPDNCRWVSLEENGKFKSTTRLITIGDITDSGRGWSLRLNKSINFINKRIVKNGIDETIEFIKSEL